MIVENMLYVIRLFLAYFFLCILLPSWCLYPLVKDRDLGYRVFFYQAAANLYLIFWGFVLSYTGLFSAAFLWLVLIVLPVAAALWNSKEKLRTKYTVAVELAADIRAGFYSFRRIRRGIWDWLKAKCREFYNAYLKGRLLQYFAWVFFAAFILMFFGQYKLHHAAYAYTDEETHLYWIQSLVHGDPFPKGMYPHGMHFLVGMIATTFHLSVARTWLNFGVFATIMIFQAAYLFLRRIFPSQAAAVFAMGLFLITDIFQIVTYFRFQMSLPMEFALVPFFVTFYGLVSYVDDRDKRSLWMFAMGLTWGLEVHFYVTIFSAFICLAFGIVFFIPMLKRRILHKVILGGMIAVFISLVPFAVGYFCGFEFERSIAWAMDVMQGGDGSDTLVGENESQQEEMETADEEIESENADDEEEYHLDEEWAKVTSPGTFLEFILGLLSYSFAASARVALWLLLLDTFLLLYGFVGAAAAARRQSPQVIQYLVYVFLAVAWLFAAFCHVMDLLELPVPIEFYRAATFLAMVTIPLFGAPVQMVWELLPTNKQRLDVALTLLVALALGYQYRSGHIKQVSGLYYNFAIQEADMRVALDVLENHERFTWTIISPVNDLSVIRYDGYHYEIVDLLQEMENGADEIYIPTSEIFVVVEEQIVDYGTDKGEKRMIDGSDYMKLSVSASAEKAEKSLDELGISSLSSRDRAYYDLRVAVMSKLYCWMEKIKEVYPHEVSVYYKDDICTVYRIQQDPYFLLNLSVDYQDVLQKGVTSK